MPFACIAREGGSTSPPSTNHDSFTHSCIIIALTMTLSLNITQSGAQSPSLALCRQFLSSLQFQLLSSNSSLLLCIHNTFYSICHSFPLFWLLFDNTLFVLLWGLFLDHFTRIRIRVAVRTFIILHYHLYAFLCVFATIRNGLSWYNSCLQWHKIRLFKQQRFFHLHALPYRRTVSKLFVRIEVDDDGLFGLGLAVALNIHKYI